MLASLRLEPESHIGWNDCLLESGTIDRTSSSAEGVRRYSLVGFQVESFFIFFLFQYSIPAQLAEARQK